MNAKTLNADAIGPVQTVPSVEAAFEVLILFSNPGSKLHTLPDPNFALVKNPNIGHSPMGKAFLKPVF